MINLAPWYYRNLLEENSVIEKPKFYKLQLLDNSNQYEAVVYLNENLRPSWISKSDIYTNCDGSGTSEFKNVAVYKAISEALERLAFYELANLEEKKYSFDLNPTTTGMAAFPHYSYEPARKNAINEAVERWAIHEFNKNSLPLIQHENSIKNLMHYEIITPFSTKVSLLVVKDNDVYVYGFAGGNNLKHSFNRALIELDRNRRVIYKFNNSEKNLKPENINDKRLIFFSTDIGFQFFNEKIKNAPRHIKNTIPKILCDQELKGYWNKYTKVWRYLLEDSYFPCHEDHTFFMF